ncbi:MAG TPA: hypothetical protein VEX13_01095 [Chloroflexia bacterium]|nr:hypothetical protein [Chloroflexia bacterium]
MAACTYCGKGAGLLSKFHPACKIQYEEGWNRICDLATRTLSSGEGLEGLEAAMQTIAQANYIPLEQVPTALIAGWEAAAERSLEDGVLTAQEETRLVNFMKHFGLTARQVNENGAFTRVRYASALRVFLAGAMPPQSERPKQLPFNLQSTEKMVWVFSNVGYFEERVIGNYVQPKLTASVRLTRGVYYRPGGFRERPIQKTGMVSMDTGTLGLTTKHLYFAGKSKSFRIPYSKIIAFRPYSDGIGVTKEAASARPMAFVTGEGWFIYNLVMNINQQAG